MAIVNITRELVLPEEKLYKDPSTGKVYILAKVVNDYAAIDLETGVARTGLDTNPNTALSGLVEFSGVVELVG